MAKVRIHLINYPERRRLTGEFFELFRRLKNKEEMIDVLLGLMTPSEIIMFARRIQIAKELLKGGSQESIRTKLRVGLDTIRNVEKWLYTNNDRRDKWLANEISHLKILPELSKKKLIKGHLDYYPAHYMLRQLLQKIADT